MKDFIDIIQRATAPFKSRFRHGRPVIEYGDNGEIVAVNISAELISKYYHNYNRKEFCPLRLFLTHITNEIEEKASESEMNKRYLKTALFGLS